MLIDVLYLGGLEEYGFNVYNPRGVYNKKPKMLPRIQSNPRDINAPIPAFKEKDLFNAVRHYYESLDGDWFNLHEDYLGTHRNRNLKLSDRGLKYALYKGEEKGLIQCKRTKSGKRTRETICYLTDKGEEYWMCSYGHDFIDMDRCLFNQLDTTNLYEIGYSPCSKLGKDQKKDLEWTEYHYPEQHQLEIDSGYKIKRWETDIQNIRNSILKHCRKYYPDVERITLVFTCYNKPGKKELWIRK